MNAAGLQAGLQALQAFNQLGATTAGAISAHKTDQAMKEYARQQQEDALREGRGLLGAQRAAFAKSGVDPGTGTAAMIQSRQRVLNRVAAGRARSATDMQRYRLQQESALGLASGLAETGTMLGKGVLDYYQNKKP